MLLSEALGKKPFFLLTVPVVPGIPQVVAAYNSGLFFRLHMVILAVCVRVSSPLAKVKVIGLRMHIKFGMILSQYSQLITCHRTYFQIRSRFEVPSEHQFPE